MLDPSESHSESRSECGPPYDPEKPEMYFLAYKTAEVTAQRLENQYRDQLLEKDRQIEALKENERELRVMLSDRDWEICRQKLSIQDCEFQLRAAEQVRAEAEEAKQQAEHARQEAGEAKQWLLNNMSEKTVQDLRNQVNKCNSIIWQQQEAIGALHGTKDALMDALNSKKLDWRNVSNEAAMSTSGEAAMSTFKGEAAMSTSPGKLCVKFISTRSARIT